MEACHSLLTAPPLVNPQVFVRSQYFFTNSITLIKHCMIWPLFISFLTVFLHIVFASTRISYPFSPAPISSRRMHMNVHPQSTSTSTQIQACVHISTHTPSSPGPLLPNFGFSLDWLLCESLSWSCPCDSRNLGLLA